MALSYVVEGAKLKCNFGSSDSNLQLPIHHRTKINGKSQANIMDHKAMLNIKPFGQCSSLTNPVVAAATAANQGKLQKMPCVPATVTPWMNGKTDNMIQNFHALTDKSTCMCMWCGKIEITNDGQGRKLESSS